MRARVVVEAPARLHFGVLDLRGDLGRRFGGIGAAVPAPSAVIEAAPAGTLEAVGPESARALEFARRYREFHRIETGARLIVHQVIPAHAGLGSGTQLGLAVARALAELYERSTDAGELARSVGRGARSGVGTWTFAFGGFVLEGGRKNSENGVAPLLANFPMPDAWRCVVAVPHGARGLSGEAEAAAFARLPAPPRGEAERVAHLVLMQLLPALREADLGGFGAALDEVQAITGGWWSTAQGGHYAPGPSALLVERLRQWGAVGVGQSSWGPAVYGLASDPDRAADLATRSRALLGPNGVVFEGGFANQGARVSHDSGFQSG